MNKEKFESIIEFAIAREEEAVKFYHDLQENTKFSGKKEFLKELELMEQGHVNVLRQIGQTDVGSMEVPEVENMRISDYLVPAKSEGEMSYQDIVITAMKREEAAYGLYNNLAGNFQDAEVKKLFQKLASEEAKHKLKFEEIYDQEILKDN